MYNRWWEFDLILVTSKNAVVADKRILRRISTYAYVNHIQTHIRAYITFPQKYVMLRTLKCTAELNSIVRTIETIYCVYDEILAIHYNTYCSRDLSKTVRQHYLQLIICVWTTMVLNFTYWKYQLFGVNEIFLERLI